MLRPNKDTSHKLTSRLSRFISSDGTGGNAATKMKKKMSRFFKKRRSTERGEAASALASASPPKKSPQELGFLTDDERLAVLQRVASGEISIEECIEEMKRKETAAIQALDE